jgi:hypothetical protein
MTDEITASELLRATEEIRMLGLRPRTREYALCVAGPSSTASKPTLQNCAPKLARDGE